MAVRSFEPILALLGASGGVDDEHRPIRSDNTVREALLAQKWVTLQGGLPRVKPKTIGGHPIEPIERTRLRKGGPLILKSGKCPITPSRESVTEFQFAGQKSKKGQLHIPIAAHKPKRLELEWDHPKEPRGALHVFDLVQRNAHGQILGGARIVTVTR